MVYELICEGSCNPQLGAIDARIERLQETHVFLEPSPSSATKHPIRHPHLPAEVIAALRHLRHTAHVRQSAGRDERYQCVECGVGRKFGDD